MPFLIQEKIGIIDLLQTERQNVYILYQLAKGVTKNVTDIKTEQEALDYIFTHVPDCITLLNKRALTKEVLFKYLHKRKVAVTADFTKAILVKKIIDFWYDDYSKYQKQDVANSDKTYEQSPTNGHSLSTFTSIEEYSEFPIHLLARKFSEWFFDNYNKDALTLNDFWSDAALLLRIKANDGIDEQICENSSTLLKNLLETRQRFGFYFNPNLTHDGVQGRMDVYGLVLVLACGTLHVEHNCVGVFECIFGLLRDPYADNNWKSKKIQLMLRSKGATAMPSLKDSETLKEPLELPVPQGDLP